MTFTNNTETSYNKFDLYIYILICSNVLGDLFSPITVTRIITICFIPIFITKFLTLKEISSSIKVFFCVWLCFSILSLLWTPDLINGLKILLYNILYIIDFFLIYIFSKYAKNPQKSILFSWTLLFVLTLPIAINEIVTGTHLPTSSTGDALLTTEEGSKIQRIQACGAYGNLNTFTVFCLFCLPFILDGLYLFTKDRICFIVAFIGIYFIILINASRGGLIASSICLVIFLYYYNNTKRINKLYLFLAICSFIFILVKFADILLSQIASRLILEGVTSDTGRMYIYNNCINVLLKYNLLGSGIGGIEAALYDISQSDIPAPHNLFLEMLSQYGIINFFFFIIMIIHIIKKLLDKSNPSNKLLGMMVLFYSIPLSLINSLYLILSIFWIFLSSLYCLSRFSKIKNTNERHKGYIIKNL